MVHPVRVSPESRGRKGRNGKRDKRTVRRPALPPEDRDEPVVMCDCPACSGVDFDPRELLDDLTSGAADLLESEDPLDAEIVGATLLAIGGLIGEGFEAALVTGLVPMFEAQATGEAMATLLAIGAVAEGEAGKAAWAAADRLAGAGVARPRWAAGLDEPVTVSGCVRMGDPQGTASVLAGMFHRAGRSHAIVMSVDHLDCGAAREILVLPPEDLPEALEMLRRSPRSGNLEVAEEALDPAGFRWHVESALDARTVHDGNMSGPGLDDLPIDEDGPAYAALAVLMRVRMRDLPLSGRPKSPHGGEDRRAKGRALRALVQLAARGGTPYGVWSLIGPGGPAALAPLPSRPDRSGPPAPVYQVRVGLRGTKPPIWRRLEVPADIGLGELHSIIQAAFGWRDTHLHMFETPYGRFGSDDAEPGHRPERPMTLEQVAPAEKSRLRYTYDFGDDWEHDILVEKVIDPDEAVVYPRCTGGRRAAPPEDCGGVWGYAELMEILNDPTHPEHRDRLEWLGLDRAADFDPGRFDAGAVTRALSALR